VSVSRRRFLRLGGGVMFGGLIVYGLPAGVIRQILAGGRAAASSPEQHRHPRQAESSPQQRRHPRIEPRWAFVVDTTKCIGCGRCVWACKQENDVPWGAHYNRTWVERYTKTADGETHVDSPEAGINGFQDAPLPEEVQGKEIVKSFFVPKLCNQCTHPPCVQVCPVSATYRANGGVVLVNRQTCIGCRYCIQACPYGARFLLPDEKVADKCTWCYHRLMQGLKPACVEVCPVQARLFGDLDDPESDVRKALDQERTGVLKEGLGTLPQVHYVGLDEEVR